MRLQNTFFIMLNSSISFEIYKVYRNANTFILEDLDGSLKFISEEEVEKGAAKLKTAHIQFKNK